MKSVDTSTSLARITSVLALGTRTDVGVLMRPKSGADKADSISESYYIETSTSSPCKFSCSFIEFDGMGDYLLFEQHEDCWKRVIRLMADQTVILVIYCHGWKHNSQSADILHFNTFLSQLASTKWVLDGRFRVHGVYLAWRGASMKPDCSSVEDRFLEEKLQSLFGSTIIDPRWLQWLPSWLAFVPLQLTYWGRKAAAEDDVSGSPISRTIFSLGYLVKRHRTPERNHRVILLGHSMGALILEQSLGNAAMSKVMADWPWFTNAAPPGQDEMVLPFDLVLLLNSAAPSIYAKEMRDFLAADYAVRKASGFPRPERPVIISVTSEADRATGMMHPIGNMFAWLSPKLQREYYDPRTGQRIPQSFFYSLTPGHNPLLINRLIAPAKAPPLASTENAFEANFRPIPGVPGGFYVSARESDGPPRTWQITPSPAQGIASTLGASWRDKANYWIVRAPKALIRNHGDIWSQQCMEMMVALWRMAENTATES